jgi:hypothetical protein
MYLQERKLIRLFEPLGYFGPMKSMDIMLLPNLVMAYSGYFMYLLCPFFLLFGLYTSPASFNTPSRVHFVWTPFAHPEYIHYKGRYRRGVSYGAGKSRYAGILEAKEQRLEGGYHIILFKFGKGTLGQAHIDSPAPHGPVFYLEKAEKDIADALPFKKEKMFLNNSMKAKIDEADGWATVLY